MIFLSVVANGYVLVHRPQNHDFCFSSIIMVFDAACHNNTASFCVRSELSDLLTHHKQARQIKSQVNDLQVQVKSQVGSLNFKSSRICHQNGLFKFDSSQPLRPSLTLMRIMVISVFSSTSGLCLQYGLGDEMHFATQNKISNTERTDYCHQEAGPLEDHVQNSKRIVLFHQRRQSL